LAPPSTRARRGWPPCSAWRPSPRGVTRPAGSNDTSGVVGTADPPYLPADSTDRRPVRGLPLRNRPRPSCAQRPCNALAHGGRSGMRESLGRSPPWCLARCVSAALSLKRLPLIPPQHGEACSPFAGIRSTKMRPRIDCAPMPPRLSRDAMRAQPDKGRWAGTSVRATRGASPAPCPSVRRLWDNSSSPDALAHSFKPLGR